MRRRRAAREAELEQLTADETHPPPLDLGEIDEHVTEMFAYLPQRLASATTAFLRGDREAAQRLVETDQTLDTLQDRIEKLVQNELARQPVSNAELRFLITVLRIVPELERSADLVEHIALRTQCALTESLSPRALAMIEQMGGIAIVMWREAGRAYRDRDRQAADSLRVQDDELDDLHVQLTDELSRAELQPSVAIELGLVARFFERLGDHAVNVTRRLTYFDATAESPA